MLRLTRSELSEPVRHLVAVGAVLAAWALTKPLEPHLQGTVLPFFFLAVAIGSLMGGYGPGLVGLFVAAILLKVSFIAPDEPLFAFDTPSAVRLLVFMGTASVLIVIAGRQHVTRAALRELAVRDGLTGLYSRRFFLEMLEHLLHLQRRSKTPLSCLLIDLDRFKSINDRFGHAAGDRALVRVSELVRLRVRKSDIAARYGGEELAVILPETNEEGARHLAEELRRGMEKMTEPVPVTVSIGVASTLPSGPGLEVSAAAKRLLTRADEALYRAKNSGRNRVCVAPESTE